MPTGQREASPRGTPTPPLASDDEEPEKRLQKSRPWPSEIVLAGWRCQRSLLENLLISEDSEVVVPTHGTLNQASKCVFVYLELLSDQVSRAAHIAFALRTPCHQYLDVVNDKPRNLVPAVPHLKPQLGEDAVDVRGHYGHRTIDCRNSNFRVR